MSDLIWATFQLYKNALKGAFHSFLRGWLVVVAVVVFAVFMMSVSSVASGLGILGGFLLGGANAFIVGSLLGLVEQVVMSSRRMRWKDVWQSAGQYFWDVLTILFIVWIPLQLLEMGVGANPYGPAVGSGVFLLLFILLNPVPEVIYQVRHGSPLDVIRESYEFVIENWIEWFLPWAIVLAPFGLAFFFMISSQGGGMLGLNFFQLLRLPFTILNTWLAYLGIPGSLASALVVVLTPIATVFVLFFRGHLFASLHSSSRRQRLFKARAARR